MGKLLLLGWTGTDGDFGGERVVGELAHGGHVIALCEVDAAA